MAETQAMDQIETLLRGDLPKVELYRQLQEIIVEMTSSQWCRITEVDYTAGTICSLDKEQKELSLCRKTGKGLHSEVIQTTRPLFDNYALSHKSYDGETDNPFDRRIKSMLIFPVNGARREVIAMITVSSSIENKKIYSQSDFIQLRPVAKLLQGYLQGAMPPPRGTPRPRPVPAKPAAVAKPAAKPTATTAPAPEVDAEKVKEQMLQFFSGTIHDIRTPLNAVNGFLELLQFEVQDEDQSHYINDALSSIEIIRGMIDNVLDFVKFGREEAPVNLAECDVKEEMRKLLEMFGSNMYQKHIAYSILMDPFMSERVVTDIGKLRRVVTNLVGNAYKFTPEYGHVTVSVLYDIQKEAMRISIKDSGVGIPAAKQSRIFEPFKQADDNTYEKYAGTGLGLSLSRNFVRLLGGELELISAEGKGSEFYFTIPMQSVRATGLAPLRKDLLHILLVGKEDDDQAQNLLRYFERFGIPESAITIQEQLPDTIGGRVTHLICFDDNLDMLRVNALNCGGLTICIIRKGLFGSFEGMFDESVESFSALEYYGDKLLKVLEVIKSEGDERVRRILIIDDSSISTKMLRAVSEKLGYEAYSELSAEKALARIKEWLKVGEMADFIFIDENMDGMSGSAFIRLYRQLERECKILPRVIISITGDADELVHAKIMDAGATDLLTKPFQLNSLIGLLKKHGSVQMQPKGIK